MPDVTRYIDCGVELVIETRARIPLPPEPHDVHSWHVAEESEALPSGSMALIRGRWMQTRATTADHKCADAYLIPVTHEERRAMLDRWIAEQRKEKIGG